MSNTRRPRPRPTPGSRTVPAEPAPLPRPLFPQPLSPAPVRPGRPAQPAAPRALPEAAGAARPAPPTAPVSGQAASAEAVPAAAAAGRSADAPTGRAGTTGRSAGVEASPVPLEVTRFGCGALEDIEPQALGMTYRFEAPREGPAATLTVEFSGRRTDGAAAPADTFRTQAVADPVLPGSGPMTVTARATVPRGRWEAVAVPVLTRPGQPAERLPVARGQGASGAAVAVQQLAPGALLGAWPALVLLGTVVALLSQALLARLVGLPVGRLLALTAVACALGVVGAKAYYLATHRRYRPGVLQPGMSIQGFVLVAVGTLLAGAALLGLRVGPVLDVTAPGLLLGMAVGRLGCFFGGCCVGRPTSSRWGLWSSDKRVGTRRIPVQLLEAACAAAVGLLALLLVVPGTHPRGLVFVGALASYTLARQLLFPLRQLPRQTRYGRPVMLVAGAVVLLADLGAAAT